MHCLTILRIWDFLYGAIIYATYLLMVQGFGPYAPDPDHMPTCPFAHMPGAYDYSGGGKQPTKPGVIAL